MAEAQDEFRFSTEKLSKAADKAADSINRESNAADANTRSSIKGAKASDHLTTAYKTTGSAAKSLAGSLKTSDSVTNLFSSSSGTLTGFLGNLIPVLSGATKGVKGLNAAIKANPIAFIITALITLISLFDPIVSGLKALVKWFSETFTAAGRAAKALREFNETRNAQRTANAKMVKQLQDDIEQGNKIFKASLDERLNIMRSHGKSETAIRAEEIKQTMAHNSRLIKLYDAHIKKLKGVDNVAYASLKQSRSDLWKQNYDLKTEFASLGNEIDKSSAKTNRHTKSVQSLTDAEKEAIKTHAEYVKTFNTPSGDYTNSLIKYNDAIKSAAGELAKSTKGLSEQEAEFMYAIGGYIIEYGDDLDGFKKQISTYSSIFTEEEQKAIKNVKTGEQLYEIYANKLAESYNKLDTAGIDMIRRDSQGIRNLFSEREKFFIDAAVSEQDYSDKLTDTYKLQVTSDQERLREQRKNEKTERKIIDDAMKEFEANSKIYIDAIYDDVIALDNANAAKLQAQKDYNDKSKQADKEKNQILIESNSALEVELENQIKLLLANSESNTNIMMKNLKNARQYAKDYGNAMQIKTTDNYSTNAEKVKNTIWSLADKAISKSKSHEDNRSTIEQAEKESNAVLDTALQKQLALQDSYRAKELANFNQLLSDKTLSQEEYNKKVENLNVKTEATKTSLSNKTKNEKDKNSEESKKKTIDEYSAELNEYSSYAAGVSSIASALADTSKANSEQEIKYKKAAMTASMAAALASGVAESMKAGWPLCLVAAASTVAELLVMFNEFKQIGNESYSKGGLIRGAGTGTSDSIQANVSNGESVINAKSTAQYAPLLSAINQANGGNAIGSATSTNRRAALTTSYVNMSPVVSVESINRQTKIYNAVNVE